MSDAQHLSVHVERDAATVYDFVRDPANLSRWAAGVDGSVRVEFVPANPYGVLDHEVTLPDGTSVTAPMRVLPDGAGCEVVFTLRRAPGVSDQAHDADAAAVRADLDRLRGLLEG